MNIWTDTHGGRKLGGNKNQTHDHVWGDVTAQRLEETLQTKTSTHDREEFSWRREQGKEKSIVCKACDFSQMFRWVFLMDPLRTKTSSQESVSEAITT